MSAIMAALYFHALGPNDRVAVKPHAGPVLHAIHYLLGSQSREALENFRGLGGAQSYPSRTKDRIPVDFSTGSVGLGVAVTLFASLIQDYLTAHGWMPDADRGRFVALIGDAELDEGNIYEALIEGHKHDVRNLWWIVDYNRQSLDATSADRMFERFDEIFRSCGWRVVELRYGKRLKAALDADSALKAWFDSYRMRTYPRSTIRAAPRSAPASNAISARPPRRSSSATTTTPWPRYSATSAATAWIAGRGVRRRAGRRPDAVRRLDHQGLRPALRRPQGQSRRPDEPHASRRASRQHGLREGPRVGAAGRRRRQRPAGRRSAHRPRPRHARKACRAASARSRVPAIPAPAGDEQSTQAAFGRILLDLSKAGGPLADRIVTTSPDVTVSTNLGAWVNQRGLFRRDGRDDVFAEAKIASAQKWTDTITVSISSSASRRTTCS